MRLGATLVTLIDSGLSMCRPSSLLMSSSVFSVPVFIMRYPICSREASSFAHPDHAPMLSANMQLMALLRSHRAAMPGMCNPFRSAICLVAYRTWFQ